MRELCQRCLLCKLLWCERCSSCPRLKGNRASRHAAWAEHLAAVAKVALESSVLPLRKGWKRRWGHAWRRRGLAAEMGRNILSSLQTPLQLPLTRRVSCVFAVSSASGRSQLRGGTGGVRVEQEKGVLYRTTVMRADRDGSAARPLLRGPALCSMGNSTSRLYSALAKTLSSSAVSQHQDCLEQPDPARLDPIDPKELLEECQIVLQKRPPRFQRDFVDLKKNAVSNHRPIRVMQWNILAQALGEGKDNFVQCPMEALKWEERKCLILEEILAYKPDILCLQEVDHYFDTFEPLLSRLGYQCTFFPKPWSPCLDVEQNNGPDGCALFFLKDRFELINSANIRLTAMKLKTNQVAIAQTLKCNETGRLFCIAVTHLKARTGWERFRSAQGCDLLQNLKNITQGAKIPLIICGDFNAEPTEEVYREFSNSSLNLNSAYKLLSPDGQSEPPYTTWKIRPSGECRHTLDYIWYSQHALNVNSALGLLTEEQIGPNRLPSFNYPSDHLSLVCDFSFNQDPDRLL
ncbi:PREDICTED: nocturnin [Charadrius vociferus]|uniref:nocturnin n=1 Tax=Charadrius vociferus TaxID=50402 RepID=UPI000521B697|nr:PREDICTED: nocturnin [Charadrius vociferus]